MQGDRINGRKMPFCLDNKSNLILNKKENPSEIKVFSLEIRLFLDSSLLNLYKFIFV